MPIRRAIVDDAEPLVHLHTRAWLAAYRGILPDAMLAGLEAKIPERIEWRRKIFGPDARHDTRNWVYEDDGALLGWASTGNARDDDLDDTSHELYAIYLEPDAIGQGHGRVLMTHCLDDVRARGYAEMVMWVLRGNARAQAFYAAAGFTQDPRVRELEFEGSGAMKLRMQRAL